jgi:hypothetical protein
MNRAIRGCFLTFVAVIGLSACSAASVIVDPGASRVFVGNQPPPEGAEQLGGITAKHGRGCGAYGSEGSFEGAHALLRNKAAALAAHYVQIVRVLEPGRFEGICLARDL